MRQSPPQRILTFLNIHEQAAAAFGSKHCSPLFTTLLKFGSSGTRKLEADHKTVVSVEESVSREKRHRDLNVVQTLRDRQNLHNIFERKAELAARGEKMAQQGLHEAVADVEVKHWEQRISDVALCEINQEFEFQLVQLQQAKQWADQAQREKINWCGELEMRNRLFRENQA